MVPSSTSRLVSNIRGDTWIDGRAQVARKNGLVTAERGRLPRSVIDAYAAAHPASTAGSEARTDTPTWEGGTAASTNSAAPPTDKAARPDTADVDKGTAPASKGNETTTRPYSRRSTSGTAEQPQIEDSVQDRLTAVEAQLAAAVARLEALEGRMTKSLLGLRVTLSHRPHARDSPLVALPRLPPRCPRSAYESVDAPARSVD